MALRPHAARAREELRRGPLGRRCRLAPGLVGTRVEELLGSPDRGRDLLAVDRHARREVELVAADLAPEDVACGQARR